METTVRSMTCKSALNRVRGMEFGWSLNPYRGCAHACVYCFARVTHTYLDLGAGSDFSTHLFAKTNVVDVLRSEVSAARWRHEQVAVGTATDPYQPLEASLHLTRGCLEVLARYRTPVTTPRSSRSSAGGPAARFVSAYPRWMRRSGAGPSRERPPPAIAC